MTATNPESAEVEQSFRVVLLGGKRLAIDCLERMLGMPDVNVVAVIPCADDDPAVGHWYPSLAQRARELGLPVHQPRSANEAEFMPVLHELQPHILLSIFYDKILKARVLEVPSIGAVNVHFGLLPYNRGSMPIPWAIIDGNDPGVTMHYMDPGVDTGDVIGQMAVPAGDHETAVEVYDRCTSAGRYLFGRHFPLLLQGSTERSRQPSGDGSYYKPGYPFERWIDWEQTGDAISRFVRALTFPPYPSARTSVAGRELEICHPVWPEPQSERQPPGTVLEATPHWVTIATGDGRISVRTIRLDGTELDAASALKRLGCSVGTRLESRPWVKSEAA